MFQPHPESLQKSAQVQQMFDRIAGTYDRLNDWISLGWHHRWKRVACEKLQLSPGSRVLDVCTGTGDLIAHLLPLVGEQGQVDGLDYSPHMLAIARKRFGHYANVTLIRGDALALPYADNTFDGAMISFGLRNVADIPRALAEMHRVIKPGGRMVNLDTAPQPGISGIGWYFSLIVPMMGGFFSGDRKAYRYLSESTRCFLTPKELVSAFKATGCQQVQSQALMLGAVSLQAGRKACAEFHPESPELSFAEQLVQRHTE